MPINFDPNSLNNVFDKNFGAGAYNSGLANAQKSARLKTQASFAKTDALKRLKAAQTAALKKPKKTYQDAVDYWNDPANKADLKKKGAYRKAEEFKSDPQQQEAFKALGFNKDDFVNAMYAAASDGKFKSQYGYNQFKKSLKPVEPGTVQAELSKSKKNSKKSPSLLDKLKKSEVGRATTAAKQFFNPFDKVKAKDAVNNYLNHKQSNTFKEVSRGANRFVDSYSLGTMSNLDKKVNKRTPYYTSERKFGEGGGTDMITSGLGYLAPSLGIAKGVKALGLGAKEATGLAKLAQIAKEGAITGGALTGAEVGIREALNPKDHNWKQNAGYVGMGAGMGAVADPLFYGAGKLVSNGLGKLAKGEVPTFTGKPSEEVLNSLKPKYQSSTVKNSDELFNKLMNIKKEPKNLSSKAYEAIDPLSTASNGGKLLRVDSLPKNKFDNPYTPGDPLPNTISHIGTKTEKSIPPVSSIANKSYIKTVDNLHRLDQFDKQVETTLGRELKPTESTHMLGLNSRGSDMISKQVLTENMVNKNGEVVGKSLKEITMKVPKGKLKEFEDYLVNKHAITRMGRGEKVFPDEMQMSPAKAEAITKNYEQQHPEFKQLADEYYNYNKQLGQHWLVDTGILSKDQWEGYLKANPHYVPNNRIFSDLEHPKFGNSAKKGFANQSNPVKKAIGSQRKIVSPIESTIEHTAQYVKTAKRNEVMQSLINNIKQDPEAFKGWAEILPTESGAGTFLDSIENKLKSEGVEGILEEFNKAFDQKTDLTKGNVVTGIIDGKKVHVKVNDPALLDAITNLTPKAQNIVISSLGQVTRVMKNLTTGINPVFSLTRNIFRDIPTAFTNSKTTNNPLVFSKDLVGSVVSVMKNDELYRSFKAVGGGHSSPISSDVNLLAQSKRSILPGEGGLLNGAKRVGSKALGALENLNNAVESAPRLAEFKRIAGSSYDSKMKGLYEANDVTVNFNKYGNLAKEVDSVVPYFNAAIQGLDKFGRTLFSPNASAAEKTAAAVKAFSAITVPSVLMFAVNHNNPDYQKVSNYIKDTNILIPKGDGTFYKIPKPRELGVIFGSGAERILRSWADNDPKAFEDFATSIKDSFLPPKRTILAPLNDLRANKNFMDAPIIPGDLENLPPQYQYDSKTSEVSKKLGSTFGFSPMKSDYLMKSYGGILGELGIPATTKNVTIGNTLKQKVTVDPVFSNDLQRRFYDAKTKLDQAHNALTKQGVTTPDLNEPLRKSFSQSSTQMGKARKQMKQIQNDQNLTPQERLAELRKYQEYINQLALQATQNVR